MYPISKIKMTKRRESITSMLSCFITSQKAVVLDIGIHFQYEKK